MRRADETTACVVISCLPLHTSDGEWRGTRGICRDVTEDREREAALTKSRNREQLLSYIVSTIRDEIEPHNMLTAAAAATARALGGVGCRIYRQTEPGYFAVAAEYGNTEGIESLDDHLSKLNDQGSLEVKVGRWHVVVTATHYRKSVNGAICMWVAAEKEEWDDDSRILIGDVANQLGIANEQITIHDRIVKLSRTDGMTGLLNRRAFFEEELPRRMNRLKHSGQGAALFYVDLDNFKMVNDVHGHQAGDDALLFLRDLMMEHSRPSDVIARLGGDEFAVWIDGVTPDVAIDRVKALMKASKELKKFSGNKDKPLGVSVGIAMYDPADDECLDDLLARADGAMYAVKKAGKGGFKVAPSPGLENKEANA
ncbi:MAG: GGDEF domain-containing protein, partial [Rhodospirillales bacterium]